jgi:hypothetical protein
MITELLFMFCGLYIGKYYPQYVPIPRIQQEYIDAVLAYLKKESAATPQTAAQTAAPTNELKHED